MPLSFFNRISACARRSEEKMGIENMTGAGRISVAKEKRRSCYAGVCNPCAVFSRVHFQTAAWQGKCHDFANLSGMGPKFQ